MKIRSTEPLAQSFITAIQQGDVEALRTLLQANPGMAEAHLIDEKQVGRTLLHIATDWPGHFPNVAKIIGLLIERGANPDVPTLGGNAQERPLHWAASSDDVAAIDALLDGGADIECPGAIFTDGAAMSDAVIFANWNAARRLLERGAKTTLTESAGLGLLDRLAVFYEQEPKPTSACTTAGLWHTCRGGQLPVAQYLVERGADLNWVGWDKIASLDGAHQSGNQNLIAWLEARGAKRARDL